jgi:hypothetical protein
MLKPKKALTPKTMPYGSPINHKEILKLLTCLNNLPPHELLLKCQTDTQKQMFEDEKEDFQILFLELHAYFTGQPSILYQLEDEEKRERFGLWVSVLLQKYDLIRHSWQYFELIKAEIPSKFPYSSPGELLAALLKDIARCHMHPCLAGRYDVKTKKLYRIWAKGRKALAKSDWETYNQFLPEAITYLGERARYAQRMILTEYIFFVAAENDCLFSQKRKIYLETSAALERVWVKSFKDSPNYAYEKGHLLTTRKAGGTYVPASLNIS